MAILYGNLIDVLNNGAPLMLVAIGMTMVIATGGVDLSVGAVIAISAAMGAVLINPALGNQLITNDILTKDATNTPLGIIILADSGSGHPVWFVERTAGFKGQNPTDGGHPDPDGGRPRNCPADYERSNYDYLLHPLFLVWKWIYIRTARFNLYRGRCLHIGLGGWCVKPRLGCSSNRWGSIQKRPITAVSAKRISSCWRIPFAAFAAPSPA